MHVTNLNIAPKPSDNKPIESAKPPLPENRENSTHFANTLKGQEKLLKETKGKDELPTPQQSTAKRPDTDNTKTDTDKEHQELTALLEKYLPPSTAEKENVTVEREPIQVTLTEELSTTIPNTPPTDITATQDMGSAIASTGLAFAKPVPTEAKLNTANEHLASEDVLLQKTTSPGPFIQAKASQEVNVPSADSTETFKQTLNTTLNGSMQKSPEITTEMLPIQKPIDTRMESAVITKPLTHPGWSKDLGEHIIWMNNKEISAAEIKLNPAHLGPISVRIDVNQDNQTSISFTAQHAETKEALETSLPKLREMLQGQQLNLVNVNISQNSNSPYGRHPSQFFQGASGNAESSLDTLTNAPDTSESSQAISKGLLSLYA